MGMNLNISQFNISGEPIPEDVADKILEFHIHPMWDIAKQFNAYPSSRSGYRSVKWEKSKGRSGNSQHTFKGKGATDWTCEDFENNKEALLQAIIENTNYTRMAIYNTFIHCDYKPTQGNKRQVFKSDSNSKWVFLKFV